MSKPLKYILAGTIAFVFFMLTQYNKSNQKLQPTEEELSIQKINDSIVKRTDLKETALSTFKFMVKKQLKDPNSFEKLEYGLDDKGDYFFYP